MYFKGNRKHFVTGFNFHKKVLLFFETTPLFELRTLETIENNLAKSQKKEPRNNPPLPRLLLTWGSVV